MSLVVCNTCSTYINLDNTDIEEYMGEYYCEECYNDLYVDVMEELSDEEKIKIVKNYYGCNANELDRFMYTLTLDEIQVFRHTR